MSNLDDCVFSAQQASKVTFTRDDVVVWVTKIALEEYVTVLLYWLPDSVKNYCKASITRDAVFTVCSVVHARL